MRDLLMEVAEKIEKKTMKNGSFESGTENTHPDKCVIIAIVKQLKKIIFPQVCLELESDGKDTYLSELSKALGTIRESLSGQIAKALCYDETYAKRDIGERMERAKELSDMFLSEIPELMDVIETDLEAAFEGDPAATGKDEIAYCYPGFSAIVTHRFAHALFKLGVPLIPRIMSESAHSETGVDIHPGAEIGHHFFIDHGTGVVIGETSVIGNHVKIYQGVTLGGLSTRAGQALKGKKRHPTIMDNVTIYSNASILGGETVVHEGVVIGGNCFITESIPAHMRVVYESPTMKHMPIQKK